MSDLSPETYVLNPDTFSRFTKSPAQTAIRRPDQVRSLTLIEPALFFSPDDPEVSRFRPLGDEVLAHGRERDPTRLRQFLKVAGAPVPDEGTLPEEVLNGLRRAQESRPPSEARL